MRFGRTFQNHQLPVEWVLFYVQYDALKKTLKCAATFNKQQQGSMVDLSDFDRQLGRDINRVSELYNRKREDFSTRLQHLQCCSTTDGHTGDTYGSYNDRLEPLTELHRQCELLNWFADINRRALFRIVRKVEKKRLASTSQCQRWLSRIGAKAFAFNGRLLEEIRCIGQMIIQVSKDRAGNPASAIRIIDTQIFSPKSCLESNESLSMAVKQDDYAFVESQLLEVLGNDEAEEANIQKMLIKTLWYSLSHSSYECIKSVLKKLKTLDEDDSIAGRNILHRAVMKLGNSESSRSISKHASSVFTTPAQPPSEIITADEIPDDSVMAGNPHVADFIRPADFKYLLDNLQRHHHSALFTRDTSDCTPLHSAALSGLHEICRQMIEKMRDCSNLNVVSVIHSSEWNDSDGYTPFHLALLHGHIDCAKIMLQLTGLDSFTALIFDRMWDVLVTCAKRNIPRSIELASNYGAHLSSSDENGETLLHIAARLGHHECVEMILRLCIKSSTINSRDNLLGSTALMNASRSGHLKVVRLLANHGADVQLCDVLGWSAKEHAAFRGFHNIVECIEDAMSKNMSKNSDRATAKSESNLAYDDVSIGSDSSSALATPSPPISASASPVILPNVSSKGSRSIPDFPTVASSDQSIIIVTLGTMNPTKAIGAVIFDPLPMEEAHKSQVDSTLSLVISASGASGGEPVPFDLPIFDDARAEPILFSTPNIAKVKLMFDIVPTTGSSKGRPVGRGVALLANARQQQNSAMGLKKGNLQGDHCVALIGTNSFGVIGSVNFNLRIVTPFSCSEISMPMEKFNSESRWSEQESTMIIGHRGLGKNMNAHKALQIGENTIQSFITAAKLGASFVEFDVQLTKDYVPVIYHDFLVGETGIDAPMHALTLEQFLYLNRGPGIHPSDSATSQSSSISEDDSSQATSTTSPMILPKNDSKSGQGHDSKLLAGPAISVERPGGKRMRRTRSASVSKTSESGVGNGALSTVADRDERLKLTHSFKTRGFKANSKDFIQEPFTTLEEMFRKLPESIGFNIEMKYPMLWEAEAYNMDPYAIDLNTYVDTILQMVFRLRYRLSPLQSSSSSPRLREIVFSSFNPDLCLLLRLKQSQIPVLFLTDAGCNPDVGDVRATTIQEAVRFAARWDLLGIVSIVDPFIKCPRLVNVIKSWGKREARKKEEESCNKAGKGGKGLVCVSYGTGNNIPENAKLQADAGIDAVIVDHVLAVHRGLHGTANGSAIEVAKTDAANAKA